MERPQITILILFVIEIVLVGYMHGKEKINKEGNPKKYSIGDTLFATIIMLFLLYMGGFFK